MGVLWMSRGFLQDVLNGVLRVSEGCLESVGRVSGRFLVGI